MGAPATPPSGCESLNVKGMVLENKETQTIDTMTTLSSGNNSSMNIDNKDLLWSNVLEAQMAKVRKTRRIQMHMKRNKRVLMKKGRITSSQGSTSVENGIETRVRTLKRLIPDCETQGLDGLFKDAAAYIMSLQMRVKLMQVMVDVLASSSQEIQ